MKTLSSTWKEMKKYRHSYLMIAPYYLPFLVFTVFSVLMAMGLSFSYFNVLETPRLIGWQNYINLFLQDDIFSIAMKNTFLFVAITGPASFILCFFVAWVINEMRPKVRAAITLVFYAPTLAGVSAFAIWKFVFSGSEYGLVNAFLLKAGLLMEPLTYLKDIRFILPILIVVQLWMSLGHSFLAFIAGLQTVDRKLYEAAAVDGVRNRWQELWYITLPVMRPFLLFGAVMQIAQSFGVSAVSINLLGFPTTKYAGRTIVTHLMDYGIIRYEMGYASAIATILFLMQVIFNKTVQRGLKRIGE
ncbi:MAG: sugar ABC transporter permease [Spirochaetales bacterium]|nr:sugar ABC transporter permease [Spirochaetales bacterium]